MESVNYNTFQILESGYAKDFTIFYYLGKKITNLDPKAFTIFGSGLAFNGKYVKDSQKCLLLWEYNKWCRNKIFYCS